MSPGSKGKYPSGRSEGVYSRRELWAESRFQHLQCRKAEPPTGSGNHDIEARLDESLSSGLRQTQPRHGCSNSTRSNDGSESSIEQTVLRRSRHDTSDIGGNVRHLIPIPFVGQPLTWISGLNRKLRMGRLRQAPRQPDSHQNSCKVNSRRTTTVPTSKNLR